MVDFWFYAKFNSIAMFAIELYFIRFELAERNSF